MKRVRIVCQSRTRRVWMRVLDFDQVHEDWVVERQYSELRPERSQKVMNHSPEGFAWGYGGSGPSQLALAILLELMPEMDAVAQHQKFKWDYVAKWPWGDVDVEIVLYKDRSERMDLEEQEKEIYIGGL